MRCLTLASGCASPPYIRFADIVDGDGVTVVVYECLVGYKFEGGARSAMSTCLPSLEWSLEASECEGIEIKRSCVSCCLSVASIHLCNRRASYEINYILVLEPSKTSHKCTVCP